MPYMYCNVCGGVEEASRLALFPSCQTSIVKSRPEAKTADNRFFHNFPLIYITHSPPRQRGAGDAAVQEVKLLSQTYHVLRLPKWSFTETLIGQSIDFSFRWQKRLLDKIKYPLWLIIIHY